MLCGPFVFHAPVPLAAALARFVVDWAKTLAAEVVRIFPDARSCLRLVRALCAETRESWMEDGGRCPDMRSSGGPNCASWRHDGSAVRFRGVLT